MSKPVSIYFYTCGSGRFAYTLRYMSAYRAGMLCMVGGSIARVLAQREPKRACRCICWLLHRRNCGEGIGSWRLRLPRIVRAAGCVQMLAQGPGPEALLAVSTSSLSWLCVSLMYET